MNGPMILKKFHIHPGMNTEPVPDNPPRNLQRQPYHVPARPQKEDGHVFASIKYAIHRTKDAQIVSPNYWETFRGCAFIANDWMRGSREWSSWQWLCTCTLLVAPALPLGLDFPVSWWKSCRSCVVWSCPWCWSLESHYGSKRHWQPPSRASRLVPTE